MCMKSSTEGKTASQIVKDLVETHYYIKFLNNKKQYRNDSAFYSIKEIKAK